MKKIIFLYIVTLYSLNINAQKNLKIDYVFKDENNHICNSTLYIIKNESLYRIDDKRDDGIDEEKTKGENYVKVNNDALSKIFYTVNKKTITRIPLYKSEVIYTDDDNKVKYKLTGKNKVISKYNCQEAKLTLNGRKYSIWFTTDFETNFGPYKINGLPGLVVELTEETNKVKITLKSIKKVDDINVFNKYKNYVLSKKSIMYSDYEQKMTEIMTKKKKANYAKMAELGVTVNYDDDQKAFTQFIIDIPTNLVSELQKIKE